MTRIEAVLLDGTVGVGKSSMLWALDAAESRPRALIDLDELRRMSPAPADDPFHQELELANLASVASTARRCSSCG